MSPVPSFPLAEILGMRTEHAGDGSATMRLDVTDQHHNPNGVVHGAVLFALVDTAMGAATMSVLSPGQLCASADVQLRFCRPLHDGTITATARVLHAGKRLVHLEAQVHDTDDRLLAFATGAFAVITPSSPPDAG